MAKNWYPVIDYSTCVNCGACAKQCAHGVYDKEKAPSPKVIFTDSCVDGCHGCGNLCPIGSITYVGNKEECCYGCDCGCESFDGQNIRQIQIDFLYLDLSVCERCQGAEGNLEEAIIEVSPVLKSLGIEILVNKINITTKDLAVKHKFLSSPTIRVNGNDICLDIKENACGCCSDISGSSVDCRVFTYNGKEYNAPPKAMIIDAILKGIYSANQNKSKADYSFPSNLEIFFNGTEENKCDCEGKC